MTDCDAISEFETSQKTRLFHFRAQPRQYLQSARPGCKHRLQSVISSAQPTSHHAVNGFGAAGEKPGIARADLQPSVRPPSLGTTESQPRFIPPTDGTAHMKEICQFDEMRCFRKHKSNFLSPMSAQRYQNYNVTY